MKRCQKTPVESLIKRHSNILSSGVDGLWFIKEGGNLFNILKLLRRHYEGRGALLMRADFRVRREMLILDHYEPFSGGWNRCLFHDCIGQT